MGLKQNFYYLLKRSAKILQGLLLEEEKDDEVADIKNFVNLLELWDDIVFGDAAYETNKRREVVLCRPEKLPDENDLKTIRKNILLKMEELTKKFSYMSSSDCVQLRDAALSRLIILNGRRDGEPS